MRPQDYYDMRQLASRYAYVTLWSPCNLGHHKRQCCATLRTVTDQEDRDDWGRRHTRVAAYALCVDDDGRILLCRIAVGYPASGSWTLPGGGITFGESPAAAVLRELTEETGLIGRIDSLAFVHSTARAAQPDEGIGPWHSVRIAYRVSITGGELRDEVDESSDRAAWLTESELSDVPLVDLVRAALAWLKDPTTTFR